MDDEPVIRNALMRRDAAAAEVRRWDEFIRTYEELVSEQSVAAPAARTIPLEAHLQARASLTANLTVLGPVSPPAETERVAAEVIRELGRPVPTREMFIILQDRGHNVGGSQAFATLSARLHRAQSLALDKGIGWRLREQSRQTNEAAGTLIREAPTASEQTTSAAVEPVGGGGI